MSETKNDTTTARTHFASVVLNDDHAIVTLNRCAVPGNRGEFEQIGQSTVRGGRDDAQELLSDAGWPIEAAWEPGIEIDGATRGFVAWVTNSRALSPCPVFDWCAGHSAAEPVEMGLHLGDDVTLLDLPTGQVVIVRAMDSGDDERDHFELSVIPVSLRGWNLQPDDFEAVAMKFDQAAAKLRQLATEAAQA